MAKTTVSTKLPTHEVRLVRWWVKRQNLTLAEFLRSAIIAAIPQEVVRRVQTAGESQDALELAFEELDKAEHLHMGMVPEGRVAPKTVAPPTPPPTQEKAYPTNPDHPCMYLAYEFGGRYGRTDCQGTCRHPNRNGSVCFWPPMAAAQCPTSRLRPRRK